MTTQNTRELLVPRLLDRCSDGIIAADRHGVIFYANEAFCRITGFARDEVLGRASGTLHSGRHDGSFFRGMWRRLRKSGHWRGEVWIGRKGGGAYPEWLSISCVSNTDEGYAHYLGILTASASIDHGETMHRLVFYDNLTGLPNRPLLEERLKLLLAGTDRACRSVALLLVGLDNFKGVNDSLGHAVGDRLLQHIAEKIAQCVRQEDTVARLAGNEFAILLSALPAHRDEVGQVAAAIAEKIGHAVASPFHVGEHEVVIRASIGIAFSLAGTVANGGDLLRDADAAMHYAKKQGGNNYQFHDTEMNTTALERLHLEHALRNAIKEEAFTLHYQLQICKQGLPVGVEALLRWRDNDISPAKFIPVAEDTGMIVQLGDWVLREACRQKAEWNRSGMRDSIPRVAINVSPRQFRQAGFVEAVSRALHESGIDPSELELELTEGTLIRNIAETADKLHKIKALGVTISVDDFGTGYSSLAYLKHFPLDMLKIDKSFVRDVVDDASDAVIVTTIIRMAQSLGLKVIAEGVETNAQLAFLCREGCDFYQGFLISEPLSAQALQHIV